MAPVQCAHEGSGEEDVADGAEPDAQNTQHAANVVARCPASPAGLACHGRCRVRRAFSGLTTKSTAWPRTAAFSSSKDSRWRRPRTAMTPSRRSEERRVGKEV